MLLDIQTMKTINDGVNPKITSNGNLLFEYQNTKVIDSGFDIKYSKNGKELALKYACKKWNKKLTPKQIEEWQSPTIDYKSLSKLQSKELTR